MRFSQNIFLLSVLLFAVSCKQSNFQTKKYLNLKKLDAPEETVQPKKHELSDKKILNYSQEEYIAAPESSEQQSLPLAEDSKDQIVESTADLKQVRSNFTLKESPLKSNHTVTPKPLILDDDVDPEVKKLENFILMSLIGATVFTVSGLIIGFLALFASSGLGLVIAMVALILLAMTCGVLSHVNAMKLRKTATGKRRTAWAITGIVAGWVWFGIAGIYGLNLLVQYLIF